MSRKQLRIFLSAALLTSALSTSFVAMANIDPNADVAQQVVQANKIAETFSQGRQDAIKSLIAQEESRIRKSGYSNADLDSVAYINTIKNMTENHNLGLSVLPSETSSSSTGSGVLDILWDTFAGGSSAQSAGADAATDPIVDEIIARNALLDSSIGSDQSVNPGNVSGGSSDTLASAHIIQVHEADDSGSALNSGSDADSQQANAKGGSPGDYAGQNGSAGAQPASSTMTEAQFNQFQGSASGTADRVLAAHPSLISSLNSALQSDTQIEKSDMSVLTGYVTEVVQQDRLNSSDAHIQEMLKSGVYVDGSAMRAEGRSKALMIRNLAVVEATAKVATIIIQREVQSIDDDIFLAHGTSRTLLQAATSEMQEFVLKNITQYTKKAALILENESKIHWDVKSAKEDINIPIDQNVSDEAVVTVNNIRKIANNTFKAITSLRLTLKNNNHREIGQLLSNWRSNLGGIQNNAVITSYWNTVNNRMDAKLSD